MNKPWFWIAMSLCAACPSVSLDLRSATRAKEEPHRSPIDVVLLPGGKFALSANSTSNSVSLIDLVNGKVLAEMPCGRKPSAVACSRDGTRAAVSNLWSGTLSLFEIQENQLKPVGEVRTGGMPRGIVFAPNGDSLYVALSSADEVARINWKTHEVQKRWPAPREPFRLALTRDGQFLAAVSARSAHARCWDTKSGKQLWERAIVDGFNVHGLTFSPDDKELIAAHVHDRHHSIAVHNIREGWALNSRLSRFTVVPEKQADYWQIGLDIRGKAVGDPCAAALVRRVISWL